TRLRDRLIAEHVPALAIVAHHAPQNVLEAEFTDIRPVGAVATIFADYLERAITMTLSPEEEADVHLATALVHALRSETDGFIRAGPERSEERRVGKVCIAVVAGCGENTGN